MHRRAASFGLPRQPARWAPARQEHRSRAPPHRVGEDAAMKAMVLAAGLGTRLRPLTSDRPKALVEITGRTLLDLTLSRLRQFGIRDVIINAHHFADLV